MQENERRKMKIYGNTLQKMDEIEPLLLCSGQTQLNKLSIF